MPPSGPTPGVGIHQNVGMPTDERPEDGDEEPIGDEQAGDEGDASDDGVWALDAALGAASLLARTVGAVGASGPARLAAGATRRLTRPLTREGHDVREQFEEDATPTAKRIVAQVAPRVTDVVDINEILAGIDMDAILEHVDLDRLLARIDLGTLLDKLDLDRVLQRIDLGALLDRIDIDAIVSRVDIGALLEQVDVGAVVDRIDVDALVSRVNVGALVARIDVNAIVAGIDVDELVGNTEIGGLIAKSTSGVASTALDAVRSQGVTLDAFVERWVNRVTRRDPATLRPGPALLTGGTPRALPAGSSTEPGEGS